MGMGTFPCHATVINVDVIAKLPTAGPLFNKMMKIVDDYYIDERVLDVENGDIYAEDYDHDLITNLTTVEGEFQKAFEADTGLRVYPFYYSDNDGDRYDDLEEGIHFSVSGVYQLTPAAEKLKDALTDVSYTIYG